MMFDEQTRQSDSLALKLRQYAQHVMVLVFGLLPLLFIPAVSAPFDYTKIIFVIAAIFIALVLYSLSVLRSGTMSLGVSLPLIALWAVVGIAFVSSLLSGDFRDSLVGDLFSTHSTAFVALLALIPSVWMILKSPKSSVMRMYILFAISTIVLVLFHIIRLVAGADMLSFGVFSSAVATPVGSWNDLALFLGLTVIISLIALEQLALTKVGRGLFAGVTLCALFMLGVINFFVVWIVIGLTSLVMGVYSLGKERFTGNQPSFISTGPTSNTTSLVAMLVVFVVSVLFVVGGATFGGFISKLTNISYVEVRPSFEATAGIARQVYHENAFLGVGANKFTDAWRLYKDSSINLTPFWNTDFTAGNGYLTTFFVTTGVLGGVAWIVFYLIFLYTGMRRLLGATETDRVWYFIGVSSFVSALYIWGMSIIYVPGVVILFLGALCTGISLSAFSTYGQTMTRTFVVGTNRRTGFLLTLAVIVIIIGSVSVLYITGRHYSSVYAFNESVLAMQRGESIDDLEQRVEKAYQLSSSDIFARRIAEYELSRMNSLVGLQNPSEQDRQHFENAAVTGVNAAQMAIKLDTSEPANWEVLGQIYGVLASLNIEGAKEKAIEALTKSKEFNPQNPLPLLEMGIIEGRAGDVNAARTKTQEAITLKQNFTEAFFFLSQLEIATGNVDAAIKSTQAVISLEPQNPARYYQLGVLYSAKGSTKESVTAFEQAISLDQNYANARYLLALAYDQLGRPEDAKKQLEAVLNLNPGNVQVTELLRVINEEGSLHRLREASSNTSQVVSEQTPSVNEDGTVSTTEPSDTSLVKPVNTAPSGKKGNEASGQ